MASRKLAEPSKALQPIATLQSHQAWLYSHVHPLFVISSFLLRFKSIIQDPVSTLTALLLPLGITQVLYVIACLPPVGRPASALHAKGNTGRKKNGGGSASARPSEDGIARRISVSSAHMDSDLMY
jgi:GPI biosynthesis protein family Pig-F